MRLKITQSPHGSVDGIELDRFQVGLVYDVGSLIAALLLAERWAEPIDDTSPSHVTSLSDVQPFTERSEDGKILATWDRGMASPRRAGHGAEATARPRKGRP